jgi:D-beta-D-heptose 7-phosphate kinase / D-beta-D-heptose 1-phosphate adenosyltransferase
VIASLQEIVSLVERGWRRAPVMVVGDVMLDKYIWGEVERISPEAPVPVVRTCFHEEKPGGAANVAMNLAGLGACVTLCGFVGADAENNKLESLLVDAGVEPSLSTVPDMPTTTKLRILSAHQQMMRLDTEAREPLSTAAHEDLLSRAISVLPGVGALVLSDYAKGVLTETVCQRLISHACKLHIPVLVDPKARQFARYRRATTICPNQRELSVATGEPSTDLDKLLAAGQSMLAALQVDSMGVTLGEKGIAVLRPQSCRHFPAEPRQVYDVSGAGDTVIAVLALAAASGMPLETAAQVANVAAGIVVSKVGTVPVQSDELLAALLKKTNADSQEKILPLEQVIGRVGVWRAASERIVFTNGCFDILHVGHLALLQQARHKGDRLIVGLNSDASVRRVKGPPRPIVAAPDRAKILAALGVVDAVVLFDESTPLTLIAAIRPDVLVKGGDYSEEDVVGAREVRAWGGRVEIIPLLAGVSTTRLIAKSVAGTPATRSMAAIAS